MIFHELPDRTDAAIAEMIDIVYRAIAIFELHQVAYDLENIFLAQRPLLERDIELQTMIQLKPTDLREIIAIRVEKQVIEKISGRFYRGRISRAQSPIDF